MKKEIFDLGKQPGLYTVCKKAGIKQKAFAVLSNTRGESLLECIDSIFIFTILIITVSMMIIYSLRVTSNSTEQGHEDQRQANAALAGDLAPPGVPASGEVELKIGSDTITVSVDIFEVGEFIAFEPSP